MYVKMVVDVGVNEIDYIQENTAILLSDTDAMRSKTMMPTGFLDETKKPDIYLAHYFVIQCYVECHVYIGFRIHIHDVSYSMEASWILHEILFIAITLHQFHVVVCVFCCQSS